MHDVVIIGGSYAGLSAALQLGRARRSVLVIDSGVRRNRTAAHAHGLFGQDGVSPAAIAATGKAEALAYPSVTWREAAVTESRVTEGGFVTRIGSEEIPSKRVILATGVTDELPAIPGIHERWGETLFACPYCHGYELNRGVLGVLGTSPWSVHQALLANEWASQLTLFLNGAFEPDAKQLSDLAARGIRLERTRVAALDGIAPKIDVRLESGEVRSLDGLFVMSRTAVHSPFAAQLGCELEDGPVGAFYKTDPMKETTVPGVFACGDAASPFASLAFAVADGVRAGIAAHQSLVFR